MTDTYVPSWLQQPRAGAPPAPVPPASNEPLAYIPEWLQPSTPESQPRTTETVTETPQPPAPENDPGFVGLMGEAISSGWDRNSYETSQLFQGLKRKLEGGTFLQPATEPEPEAPPEVQRYLQMPIRQGWSDPRWYGVNLAYGIPSMMTQLGASAVGSVVGSAAGPAGTVAGLGLGFGLAGGGKTLIPALKEAEAKGLRGDDAASYAIRKGVLTGAFDAASTSAFGIPLAGQTARAMAAGVFGDAAGPFLADAAAQLGIMQPSIEAARVAASTQALEGRDATPTEMFDAVTANVGMNVVQMALVHTLNRTIGGMKPEKPFVPPTSEEVKKTIETKGVLEEVGKALVPEGGTQPPGQEPEVLPPRTIGEMPELRGHVQEFPRPVMDRHEIVDWLKGRMPNEAEALDRLDIPRYLGDNGGKITKEDILQHIDERQTSARFEPLANDPTRGTLRFERTTLDPGVMELHDLPVEDRIDRDGTRVLAVDAPGAPTRILRYAADNGFDRVAFTADKLTPEVARWARKLGMTEGITDIKGRPYRYLDLNPAASSNVRVGYPQWEPRASKEARVDIQEPKGLGVTTGAALRPAAVLAAKAVQQFARKFKITAPIRIDITDGKYPHPRHMNAFGVMESKPDGSYVITIPLANHVSAEGIYSSMAHEFGHVLFKESWKKLDDATKRALLAEWKMWRRPMEAAKKTGGMRGPMERTRTDAAYNYYLDKMRDIAAGRPQTPLDKLPMSSMTREFWRYWAQFEEWTVTQVARWATTDARPMSVIDKTFSSLGNRIRQISDWMVHKTGMKVTPPEIINSWLNDMLLHGEPWAADSYDAMDFASRLKNQAAFRKDGTPEIPATQQTMVTQPGREAMGKLPHVEGAEATAAHADRFHWLYNQWLSLPQVVARNPHIQGLVRYGGLMRILNQKINTTMNGALETLQGWRGMGSTQRAAVGSLIRDYMLQVYRTPDEVRRDISRKPSAAEMTNLITKHKVDATGLKVFQKVMADLNGVLDRYQAHMLEKTKVITDPVAQAKAIQDVNTALNKMRSEPYFPMARFGDFTVTIYDPQDKVVRFELADNAKLQKQIQERLQATLLPGERIQIGKLFKDAHPFIGLPPGLLDTMATKMNLSATQREALNQLKFEYTPARSFAHHFRQRSEMPGWSEDFIRAYAQYFFNYSRWMAKAELLDDMMGSIDDVRKSTRAMADASKRVEITNFMVDHYNSIMDPKSDYAWLRSALFHMYLGANPASAALNLTQTLTSTYPWLAGKFGDLRAVKEIMNASGRLSSYYRKNTLTKETSGDLWMLGEMVRKGLITEGQAHNLSALTQMDNLNLGFGRTAKEKTLNNLLQSSSFMFEMAEQWNRRVAARAAWRLALNNPDAKYVKDAIQIHPLEYKSILDQGRNPREAAAFVTAMDAVENTQYVYAPYGRPKAFRGGFSSLPLVFKLFTQNTLFQLWNYPGVRMRGLLMFGALAGLTGVPGAQDALGLIKSIAYRLFGKDFDVEDEVRKFSIDVLKAQDCRNVSSLNPICPDILLHGLSRHGFGIPQLFDMMGHTIGLEKHIPIPTVDMSASVGMGRVLPFEIERLLGPQRDPSRSIAESVTRLGGAGMGYTAALYRAITNEQLDASDWKRWEQIMPKFVSNVSHAWRYYQEGGERNARGNMILRFDPNEPVQMAEILARSIGFQPARLTQQWERIGSEIEATTFWQLSHDALIRQLWHATQRKDVAAREKVEQAIKNFNHQVEGTDARGYAITTETIQKSFQQRAIGAKKQEMGIPTQRRAIPLIQEIQRLHPGAEPIGRQRVE